MATRKPTKTAKYDESHIEVYTGLEGIRNKPSMYLGDMQEAPWTCVREVADNCQDEWLAGRNDGCLIVYDGEYVWVADKGEGIPIEKKSIKEANGEVIKESTLKSVLSRTHAGGKFTDKAYKTSAGTHGIGIKAVNAVSSEFEVWTCRDKKWYHTKYGKGVEVSEVSKAKAPSIKKAKYTAKKGTVVRFKLDASCFPKGATFDSSFAHRWATLSCRLNAGFTIVIVDDNGTVKYHEPDGLWSIITSKYDELKESDLDYDDVMGAGGENLEIELENDQGQMWCDFAFIMPPNVEGTHLSLYTNGVSNPDGGVHQQAFWTAMQKALKDLAPAKAVYTLNDLKEGLIGVLNIKINSPAFNNQTKEKLTDARVKTPLEEELTNQFYQFFKSNKPFLKEFFERLKKLNDLRSSQQLQRKALLTIKKATSKTPSKLAGVVGSTPKDLVEIFLVEGDSAGGTAKTARYKNFQASLPLKGKPLNALRNSEVKALASEEIQNIFGSLGYVPNGSSKVDTFGKLILLNDADDDGSHIDALVLCVIQTYMPELFEQEKVFIVDTRHCKIFGRGRKGAYYFGATAEAVHKEAKASGDSIVNKVQYLKGWGELSAEGLRWAAFNPNTRKLIKVTGITKPKQLETYQLLMGEDSEYRKAMLGVQDTDG